MTFVLPNYSEENLWGPSMDEEEPRVFSKQERTSKLVDWQMVDEDDRKKSEQKNKSGFKDVKSTAELKELKRATKEKSGATAAGGGRGGFFANRGGAQGGRGGAQPWGQQAAGGRGGAAAANTRGGRGGGRGNARGGRGGRGRAWQPREQVFCAATLKLREDLSVTPIDTTVILKNQAVDLRAGVDIAVQGKCALYDEAFEATSNKKPMRLPNTIPNRDIESGYLDPVMRKYIADTPDRRVLFGSDTVIAKLMTCPASVNSYDVQVNSNGRFIAVLERNTNVGKLAVSDSRIDYEWVNETAPFNVPSEDNTSSGGAGINTSVPLALENQRATKEFHGAVKSKSVVSWAQGGTGSPYKTNTIFRYRKWVLNPGTPEELDVVIRCEIDAANKGTKQTPPQFMKLFSLLEGPPHADAQPWKAQADKAGALLIKAIGSNKSKVSYWAALSLLAGVDLLKIALVTRTNVAATELHDVIGVATCPARDFATQLGVSLHKLFGNLSYIAAAIYKQSPEGKVSLLYLMKEPRQERLLILDPSTVLADADSDSSSDDSSDSSDSDDSDSSDSSDSDSD